MNKAEFFLMNNPLRAFIQEKYELPILLQMSADNRYSRVLEIGCGNGNGTRLIKKYYNPQKIIATDLDEKMIEVAQKNNNDNLVDFIVMDASNLEFSDKYFDAVFDFGIIHHIPNWRDCIRELNRVLKDDGELILEELSIESFSGFPGALWKSILVHPYDDMFTFNELVEYIEENGFTILSKKISNPLRLLEHISLTAKVSNAKNSYRREQSGTDHASR